MGRRRMKERYLGDGVYVRVEHGMLRLHTTDGICELDIIYLELPGMEALIKFYEELKDGANDPTR